MQAVQGTHNDDIGRGIVGWYCKHVGCVFEGPFVAISWIKDNNPIACVIFNEYNGHSIAIHFYGPNSLTKGMIKLVMWYVFDQLKCTVMTAKIKRNNAFRKILPRMGYRFIGVIPNFFGDGKQNTCVIYALQSVDAKRIWLKNG